MVPDEATAVSRALELTVLERPIRVVRVQQGRAGELVDEPTGFFPNEQEGARALAKRQRPAWGITLIGRYRFPCSDPGPCPLVETQHQLAIDRQTGELLLQIIGGDIPAAALS